MMASGLENSVNDVYTYLRNNKIERPGFGLFLSLSLYVVILCT